MTSSSPPRPSNPPVDSDPPASASAATVPAEQWPVRSLRAHAVGDFLATYDAAMRDIAGDPQSVPLRHRAIVALASTGATAKARAMLRDAEAARGDEDEATALEARLAREHALSVHGEERARHALTAATLYECIHARTRGIFSGINAASMHLFAGDPARAAMLAKQVLDACAKERPASPEEAYYVTATEAQAALLLGDVDKAESKLRMVRLLSGDDHAIRAALRRQLRRICDEKRLPTSALDVLKPPSVAHYTGFRAAPVAGSPRPPSRFEIFLAEQIADYITTRKVGFGYGSLTCGGDILFAERLLASGAELCVVLPAPEREFRRAAVEPWGEGWAKRFKACLDGASSVTVMGTEADAFTDQLLTHGSRTAMGLSILRARALDADLEQVALWGGDLVAQVEGASEPPPDVATWRARGLSTHLLDPGPIAPLKPPTFAASAPSPDDAERLVCAMLFGEITGYNALREASIPVFVREVMGAFAGVLDSYGADVLFRGMWGERVYIVMSSAPSAAQCALDLQARMASIPLASLGLPPSLSLRLGGHLGPVYRGYDPIAKGPSFFGMDIARTARLEPIMPEGEVFVTEPFAAALMLDSGAFSCDYVGTMQVSKGPSGVRAYVLKRD